MTQDRRRRPVPDRARIRAIRARMAQTGENVTTAARHIDAQQAESNVQPTTVRIGRAPDNNIIVTCLQAARHHAELRIEPDGYSTLVDLDSRSGTYVNGKPMFSPKQVHLNPGDLVGIGSMTFRFTDGTLTKVEPE